MKKTIMIDLDGVLNIYLDDRALKFNGDFGKTLNEIENFNVYWKK